MIILKGSTITIQNGKITTPDETGAKILIQNYSNLTLDNVELVGADVTQYVLSNNFGDTTLENGTKITAADGQVAFDVYYGLSAAYDAGVSVTIADTDVVINGVYEYGKADRVNDAKWYEKATLIIAKDHTLEALDGYEWVTNGDVKQLLKEETTEKATADGAVEEELSGEEIIEEKAVETDETQIEGDEEVIEEAGAEAVEVTDEEVPVEGDEEFVE